MDSSETNGRLTPMEMVARVDAIAIRLLALPEQARNDEVFKLKVVNPVVYALLRPRLRKLRNAC